MISPYYLCSNGKVKQQQGDRVGCKERGMYYVPVFKDKRKCCSDGRAPCLPPLLLYTQNPDTGSKH